MPPEHTTARDGRGRLRDRLRRTGSALSRSSFGSAMRVMPPVLPLVSFVDALGTGMFLTGSALFFTRDLGLTAGQVGLGLTLGGLLGFACLVPIGRLADRLGAREMLVVLQLWRGACFVAYLFAGNFPAFLVVACLAGTAEWGLAPVLQSLIGSVVSATDRVKGMATLTLVRNIGFVVGAGAASAAVALGGAPVYRGLVVLDVLSFFVSGLMLLRLRVPAKVVTADAAAETVRRSRPGPRYLVLTVLNGLLYLHVAILSVGLPLWIVTRTSAPPVLVGLVTLLNPVLAAALQLRLTRGVEGVRAAANRQLRAGVALAVCTLLVGATAATGPAATIVIILLATVALTVGEIYQAVGGWGISYDLAPEQGRGRYLSVYNLGSTGAMIVGPWLLTSPVLSAGGAGWLVLALVLAAAGVLVALVARRPPDHIVVPD